VGRNDDDLRFLQRCIASEPGAWREFVERFGPTVYALARRCLRQHGRPGDDAETQDIVQDVMLALMRRNFRLLRNYDPTYTVKTYLGVIARTEVHRLLRKRRPQPVAEVEERGDEEGSPDDSAAAGEEREAVQRALDELPDRDAEILRLRFYREKDYRAIAGIMGIPESSVGQTLYRAKRKLLDRLKGFISLVL